MRFRILILTISILAMGPALYGQSCANYMLRGPTAVACSGWMSLGQGQPQVPFVSLGTASMDASGMVTGTSTASIGGAIVTQVMKGQPTVNPDCTGTVTYTQTINGQPAPDVHLFFVVYDFGNVLQGTSRDPGASILCTVKRLREY